MYVHIATCTPLHQHFHDAQNYELDKFSEWNVIQTPKYNIIAATLLTYRE